MSRERGKVRKYNRGVVVITGVKLESNYHYRSKHTYRASRTTLHTVTAYRFKTTINTIAILVSTLSLMFIFDLPWWSLLYHNN